MRMPEHSLGPGLKLFLKIAPFSILLVAVALYSVNAAAFLPQTTPEWQAQASGTSEVLLGVAFTSINNGYAVGTNGTIRITSNGGISWSSQPSGTNRFLRDVSFSDSTHGVIVGESGLILRTTDGATWNQQVSGTTQHLVHVHLLNNSVGMASGQGGVILKTTDGGVSWTPQTSGTTAEIPGIHLLDENTAVAVGFGGTIRRTTNGGATWSPISVAGFTLDLRSVHFSGNTGIAVSMGGGILRSTDAGQSWNQVSSGTTNALFAVKFRDANTVFAAGTARVLVSRNAGSSWSQATTTPFGSDLYALSFASAHGWAVGQFGLILHNDETPAPTPTPTPTPTPSNPIDDASFFVRQHYRDFLNREADSVGLDFWTSEITSCGSDPGCVESKRINVSAAVFLSIEFQQTGYLVERLYKTAYGDATGTSTFGVLHQLPVPIVRITEFLPDTQAIAHGVVVGQPGWETVLENNKQSFLAQFVERSRFSSQYPNSMTAAAFVDTLNNNAGNPLSTAERNQLISDLNTGAKTRAQVLRAIAEDSDLLTEEFNRAFVLMQYVGYVRRNPNDPPDSDYTGYDFWLTKLNGFTVPGDDPLVRVQRAEMVKAFIVSGEYRQRFASPATAALTLSASPNPINGGPCAGCGGGSTDRETVTNLSIHDTGGVGGAITSIAMELRENGTNALLASGSFNGDSVAFFTGTTRLQANATLIAQGIGVHYAQSVGGRPAVLTFTVFVTDDLGNHVTQTLSVPAMT